MVRVGRPVELLHVTGCAIGGSLHELSVDVALRAGHVDVRARERELRERVVIEGGRVPGGGAVTGLASLRKASLHVGWIIGLVEVV